MPLTRQVKTDWKHFLKGDGQDSWVTELIRQRCNVKNYSFVQEERQTDIHVTYFPYIFYIVGSLIINIDKVKPNNT